MGDTKVITGQTHQRFFISPQNQETVQAELNRFAVQMLVQSPDFAIYIYSSDAVARLLQKNVRNFISLKCNS